MEKDKTPSHDPSDHHGGLMSHAARMKRMGRACSAPCRFIVWAIRRSRTREMKCEARNRERHGECMLGAWRIYAGSMAEQCTSDGEALCLSLGETGSAFSDFAVDTVWKFLYKIPGTGSFQGIDDFIIRCIRLYIAHIFCDCSGEHGVSLRNIGE